MTVSEIGSAERDTPSLTDAQLCLTIYTQEIETGGLAEQFDHGPRGFVNRVYHEVIPEHIRYRGQLKAAAAEFSRYADGMEQFVDRPVTLVEPRFSSFVHSKGANKESHVITPELVAIYKRFNGALRYYVCTIEDAPLSGRPSDEVVDAAMRLCKISCGQLWEPNMNLIHVKHPERYTVNPVRDTTPDRYLRAYIMQVRKNKR